MEEVVSLERGQNGQSLFSALTFMDLDNIRGPGRSCSLILNQFHTAGLKAELLTPRANRPLAPEVAVHRTLPRPLRPLPWRFTRHYAKTTLLRSFSRALKTADPEKVILYFWPHAPVSLLKEARSRGFVMAREMINNPCRIAKPLLDEAYGRRGLGEYPVITWDKVEAEDEELTHFDLIFASNNEVENSLRQMGIADHKIEPTAFGFDSHAFTNPPQKRTHGRPVRYLFLGTMEVRKGFLDLLDAWKLADLDAELLLAGHADPLVAGPLATAMEGGKIRHLGFVSDIAQLLSEVDVFVFPTIEEGGPQVTCEAAAMGLPTITTRMGAGRLVRDGENGIIVPAMDPEALAAAMTRLADDVDYREKLGRAAALEAPDFSYERVGHGRAETLVRALNARRG
ncbi:glycosyltransferase family 4 protein [Sphingomonas azotifigens]|uniref:glycosyltransferase family 4 protein n=1 Tax=Sphingomonas azotifigens TaxID=330920 RepID=UPI000A05F20D|nr:glycosyltransferase family 4 protein [Sphingomonas azotifigens]